MGTTTTGTEDVITIEPPLVTREIRDWPEYPAGYGGKPKDQEIQLLTEEIREELDEGDLIWHSGYAIATVEPYSAWKRYNSKEQLQAVVDAYPDHEFKGFLEFLDDDGQRWRLVVDSERVVRRFEPELVWPS